MLASTLFLDRRVGNDGCAGLESKILAPATHTSRVLIHPGPCQSRCNSTLYAITLLCFIWVWLNLFRFESKGRRGLLSRGIQKRDSIRLESLAYLVGVEHLRVQECLWVNFNVVHNLSTRRREKRNAM